jgi:pyruvate dehydrogenase E2 component (dihydrolipoamide acetyltransferase)
MAGAVQTRAIAAVAPTGRRPVRRRLGAGPDPWPKVDFAKFGPDRAQGAGRIKKISGANLMRNAVMIPAVTNHDDADITDLEAFRVATNKENEKAASRSRCWPS